MKTNNLRRSIALLAMMLALAGGLDARTKKGDRYLKDGKAAEARQQWDEALDLYEKALATDPSDSGYMIAAKVARFQASQRHIKAGVKLREQGDLEGAVKEFQQAMLKDAASPLALQEWRRTSDMVEREKTGQRREGADRGLTPAQRARQEIDARVASILPPPELKPISQLPATLKMNNQPPRVLYETIGKLAGINVVFDPQYQSAGKNFNLDLNGASLEQALDYLGLLTKTFSKPISSNTIFVAEDNITKRRDYEDNVARTFYIQNATSVQEFQEIVTAVRSLTELRRVFSYNAQRAVLIRGTPDQVALAEKLIHDLDKPKAEVVVDIMVLSANSSKTRTLAAQITSGTTSGLNVPISFSPRSSISTTTTSTSTAAASSAATTTTSTAVSLANLSKVDGRDFITTLPGVLLNFVMSDNQTKVLQSPQVRASDGQKVTLRIGQKIPYATGSLSSGVGSVSGVAYAQTQFNYAEVGVNIDLTPTVHGKDEVTLKVMVEISSVATHVTIGGVDQPVIAQQKSESELRLREGEVNILGGLSQDSDSKTINGVPGLVNIPILGRLLGGESVDKERNSLLIVLIPHIVRTADITDVDVKEVLAGSDQVVRVSYAPKAAPVAGPPAGGTSPAPVAPAPDAAKPAPPVLSQPPIPGLPSHSGPRLTLTPPGAPTALGGALTLTLQAENMQDLFTASPIRIKWDPKVLRLNEIAPGAFLSHDDQRITSAKDIRNDAGEAWITMNRLPGAGGVNGTGPLASLSFTAIGKGNSKVTVTEFGLRNTQLQPITVTGPEASVDVQ